MLAKIVSPPLKGPETWHKNVVPTVFLAMNVLVYSLGFSCDINESSDEGGDLHLIRHIRVPRDSGKIASYVAVLKLLMLVAIHSDQAARPFDVVPKLVCVLHRNVSWYRNNFCWCKI